MRRLCEMKFLWRYTWRKIKKLLSVYEKQIVNNADKRLDELNKMMPLTDSKERDKIREKKLAHGQKKGADGYGTDDEEYFGLSM